MTEIGKINKLKVTKRLDFGVYLDGGECGEILLPIREVPENVQLSDELEVFIYFDSEDRLIATTHMPKAKVGDYAVLDVISVSPMGAFLDWGLPKDLFLPFAEQTRELRPGFAIIVFVYLDKSERIAASMRIEKRRDKTPVNYVEGQEVELLIAGRSELGYKAIINGRHWGIIYKDEVFQDLQYSQRTRGYIKKLRDDGKIDLSFHKMGRAAADEIASKILEMLEKKGGFLAVNDKTPAETIYRLFGVSKKKYKIALGGLYKRRLITVAEDGIRKTE